MIQMKKTHISEGNRKMGAIPSFSLPSGVTCSREACATCYRDGCYGRAMERRLPSIRNAYAENYDLLRSDMSGCKEYLNWYFDSPNAPRMFRIHVVGDFFSREYLQMWIDVIRDHPQTLFMAFTKQFEVVQGHVISGAIPENFALIASAWPGANLPDWVVEHMPIAYMQDGTETRVPDGAYLCDGDCAGNCRGQCWKMHAAGQAVVFEKHGPGIKKKERK